MIRSKKTFQKIAVFTRYDRLGASSRLRFYQFQDRLQLQGFYCDFYPLFDDEYLKIQYQNKKKSKFLITKSYLRRLCQLLLVIKYDVIWLEKELFPGLPAIFEKLLSWIKPYVVDYDDAIFHNYDLSSNFWVRLFLKRKIDQVMQSAKIVIVGSPYLLERARAVSARNIQLIPTVIDENKYFLSDSKSLDAKNIDIKMCKINKSEIYENPGMISSNNYSVSIGGSVVIGWVGSPATQFYLKEFSGVFSDLQKKYSQLQFHFVGVSSDFEIVGINHENIPWTEDTEVFSIQKFDIGIMPLKNTPWELGKCGYKLIQFMACGKPVVASRVGANISIVSSDVGFLCGTNQEWNDRLTILIENSLLRLEYGRAARKLVQSKYCIRAVDAQLNGVFLSALV